MKRKGKRNSENSNLTKKEDKADEVDRLCARSSVGVGIDIGG
jgi:hypothetical protein